MIHLHPEFDAITLEHLNQSASMLNRFDTKYVLDHETLEQFLRMAKANFAVLDINGNRAFQYETCYFDDGDLGFFTDHLLERKQHMKIRTRLYVNSGQSYLEVKMKNSEGFTNKRRFERIAFANNELTTADHQFIAQTYSEFFGAPFEKELNPKVNIKYHRHTFVSKIGGERFTIDFHMSCSSEQSHIVFPVDSYIVEVKSRDGNGVADSMLRALNQQRVDSCSKYCLSLCLTKKIKGSNKFLPTLTKLGFDIEAL